MDVLLKYMRGLEPATLTQLYQQSASCVVLVRAMPDLGKQIVMRLLFLDEAFDDSLLSEWFRSSSQSASRSCLKLLRDLHIIEVMGHVDEQSYILNEVFRVQLRRALFMGHASASSVSEAPEVLEKHRKSVTELNTYALARWECLLQFLAICSETTMKKVSQEMQEVLKHGELVRERSDGHIDVEITSAGFQFLLVDKHRKMQAIGSLECPKFEFLLQYISYARSCGTDIVPMLCSLFRLCLLDANRPYLKHDLNEELLLRCREIGLVHMRKRTDDWFYVTPMIHTLTGAAATSATDNLTDNISTVAETSSVGAIDKQRFLVLETNFRVYAYTDSMLQLSILSTFCDVTYRFSNMSVGVLTRESVRNALQVGITAEQIISYLSEHARTFDNQSLISNNNKSAANGNELVPGTVADQIRLWELERNRFRFEDATMYSVFDSDSDYQRLVAFVSRQGLLLWNDDRLKQVVARTSGHNDIKAWFQRNKQR